MKILTIGFGPGNESKPHIVNEWLERLKGEERKLLDRLYFLLYHINYASGKELWTWKPLKGK